MSLFAAFAEEIMRTDHLHGLVKKGSDIKPPRRCKNGMCARVIKRALSIPPAPEDDFCNSDCWKNAQTNTSQARLRALVWERDKGVCTLCHVDTKSITGMLVNDRAAIDLAAGELRKLSEPTSPGFSAPSPGELAKARAKIIAAEGVYQAHLMLWKGFPREALEKGESLWQAHHHPKSKVLGAPNTLQAAVTACLACHGAETRKLAGDRAASRRPSTDPRFWKAHGERRKNKGMR